MDERSKKGYADMCETFLPVFSAGALPLSSLSVRRRIAVKEAPCGSRRSPLFRDRHRCLWLCNLSAVPQTPLVF